jgi:hypothetical protein
VAISYRAIDAATQVFSDSVGLLVCAQRRVRFTARATGSRARAQADAFHAPTVAPSRATMRGGVGPVRSEKSCQTSDEW